MMPVDIFINGTSPLPNAGPRQGKRRTQSAEHLTSSPYKDNLREKNIIKRVEIENAHATFACSRTSQYGGLLTIKVG